MTTEEKKLKKVRKPKLVETHPLNDIEIIDDLILNNKPLPDEIPQTKSILEPKTIKIKKSKTDPCQYNLFDVLV